MGGNPHAPAAFAEIDRIQIPLQNFLLIVFLFKLQSSEDLGQLSGNGNLVLAGQVFQQLLRDGGTTVAGLHACKHLNESTRSTIPVYPFMLIEALVLDGNQGLFHIFRDVFIFHPDAALVPADGNALLPFSCEILMPDGAGLTQLIILQGDIKLGRQAGFDIVGKNTGEERTGHQQNQKKRADDTQDRDQYGGERVDGVPACPQKAPGCTAFFQLFFRGGVFRSHRVSRHFLCSSGDENRE